MAINAKVPAVCCSHLEKMFRPKERRKAIQDCLKALEPHKDKFDAIAISGYSMALIAPTIADKLGKGLILVRKGNDDCASPYRVEGAICDSYIIIDDLVCSRETFHRVVKGISDQHHSPAKLYGIYLYDIEHSSLRSHKQVKDWMKTRLLNDDNYGEEDK